MTADVPLHQHWRDVYRLRWLVLLTAAAAGAIAHFVSIAITPVYEAKTTFYLATNAPSAALSTPGSFEPPVPLFPMPEEKAASLNVGIIKGREIMGALAAEFAHTDMATLRRRLDVVVSGEFMIDVFVRDPDPALAAAIAERVPSLYAGFHEATMRRRAEVSAAALGRHLEALQIEAADLDAERARLRAALGAATGGGAVTRAAETLDLARERLRAHDAEAAAMGARLASLRAALSREAAVYELPDAAPDDAALERLRAQALDLRLELASSDDGPASPRRLALVQQLDAIEAETAAAQAPGTLHETVRAELATTEAAAAGLDAARPALLEATAQAEAALTAAFDGFAALDAIDADRARLDAKIAAARVNLEEAALQAAYASAPLVVVERATPPERPAFPLPMLNAIVAAVAGLLFGVYYALLVAYIERARLRRAAETADAPPFTPEELAEFKALAAGAARV